MTSKPELAGKGRSEEWRRGYSAGYIAGKKFANRKLNDMAKQLIHLMELRRKGSQ